MYGSPTPKRQYAYSSSPAILKLDIGWKRQFTTKTKTVRRYINKKGEKKYVGTKHLRTTESLVYILNDGSWNISSCEQLIEFNDQ